MELPKIPENESERLESLRSYQILDTLPEPAFDDITLLASQICGTPVALISLIDEKRQWFKSHLGLDVSETPREIACCAHAINDPGKILEIEDTLKDKRFFDNPLATGAPHVRFYAGAPLVSSDGFALGTLCVIDHQPRKLTNEQRKALEALSRSVVSQLELKKNEKVLKLAQFSFDNSPEGFAWVDEDSRIIKFNDRYAEILGYPREALINKKIYELDPNFTEETWRLHWQEMMERKTMILESASCSENGEVKPIELRLKILDYEGKQYIHAICMDISLRKNDEKKIKESEANLTALIENTGDTIWSVSADYRYIAFNSIFCQYIYALTGKKPKAGEKIDFDALPAKVREYWSKKYEKAFKGERFIDDMHVEYDGIRRTFETSFNPIMDDKAEVIGVSVFARDVTNIYDERQKKNRFHDGLKRLNDLASAENMSFGELMRKSLKLIAEFLDMPLGVISRIRNGKYRILSYHTTNREIYPFETGMMFDLEGTYCDITYRQNGVIAIDEMKNSPYHSHVCYQGQKLESYIGAIITVDNKKYGTVNFCDRESRKTNFDSYDKEFLQLFANWIGSEIGRRRVNEQLKKAKDRAEAASVAKDNFLSTMSHEIRTPLNAIIGMTHILLQDNPVEHQVENLDIIRFSGENLLVLINDILDYNKIEANKLIIEEEDFDLKALLSSIKASFEFKTKEKGISFRMNYDDNIPGCLVGDSVRIVQVITNLIGNAIKFTEQGGVVLSISLKKEEKKEVVLHLEVQDTGIGIRKEKLKSIFERFVQAESSTTRKYGGTGLGLSITRKLLKMMGSEIMVESEPGKGTKFYFDLPLAKGETQRVHPSRFIRKELTDLSAYNIKILVAEDNEANQLVIGKFLNRWGIHTEFARDGNVALDMIRNKSYDMVLMDLQMPDLDGFTATRKIRQMPGSYFMNVPVLALTASVMNNVKERALNAGMNDYITKPFTPDELYNKLIIYLNIPLDPPLKPGPDKEPVKIGIIDQLAGGDESFRNELIKNYLENITELREGVMSALEQHDSKMLSHVSHKMKFTLETLQAHELLTILAEAKEAFGNGKKSLSDRKLRERFTKSCDQLTDRLRDIQPAGI